MSDQVGQTITVEGTDEPCLTVEMFDKMVDHLRNEKMPHVGSKMNSDVYAYVVGVGL
jgi:hypothetical protein